jgi:hypothetical protein
MRKVNFSSGSRNIFCGNFRFSAEILSKLFHFLETFAGQEGLEAYAGSGIFEKNNFS